jgi:NAD(P)H dehydrogenase (quinone)
VSGVEAVTGPQLAQIFSRVLGRPLTYYAMSPSEMKAALEAAFGPGAGDDVAEEYALDQADPNPPAKHYDMASVLRQLPVTMTSISAWVAENVSLFS